MISSIYAKEITSKAWYVRRKTDRYSWAWNPKANPPSKARKIVLKSSKRSTVTK